MKNFITLVILVAFAVPGWSQERNAEKIQAFKTGYLTQELDLSPEEAQKFWPVYNEFDKKMFNLRVEKRRKQREKMNALVGPEAMTDAEARDYLTDLFQNEDEILSAKKELYKNLEGILPAKKLLILYKAEHDFNRRLLSEYRRRGPHNPQD